MPINNGRILVTGATGLIGSCIIDVFQIANDYLGCSFEIYALGRNIERLSKRFSTMKSVHCVAQDITNPINIDHVDYIIHTASNADPVSYAQYPVETILTNVIGAKTVLDYCICNKKTRVLFTSTFEVYGKLEKDEYKESDFGLIDNSMLRSCYPESKRTAELLFRSYKDEYDIDCVIARLSSVYGPTMLPNDSKAHAQFLRNAINGEDIVLKSKGTQKRTYCYVIDAVSGILSVLFNGKSGEAYNVANEKSISTIAELAKVIADMMGTKVIYDIPNKFEQKGFSKPQNCILNTEKICSLGWQGAYTLQQGIAETLEILKETEDRGF